MAKAMIKREIDEYGFESLDVRTSEGGHKTITFFGAGTVDIGTVSGMNPHGIGTSDYIRKADDVKRHIANVERTVWLNDDEKVACFAFLREIEIRAHNFLTVKDRFDVKRSYVPDSRIQYTFTEKEPVMTLHTKISITIVQPSGWDEGNAWRALYDSLDAMRTRKEW